MYGTTKERAEELAAILNEQTGATFRDNPVERFEVHAHSWAPNSRIPTSYGIVARWRYADRPELGVFGGEFLALGSITR